MIERNRYPVTVKLVGNKHYEVEMFEMPDGSYCIRSQNKPKNDGHVYVEDIRDYNLASWVFDLKVKELEGV